MIRRYGLATTIAATLTLAVPAAAQTTVFSTPVGVLSGSAPRGQSGLAVPLIAEDPFVGVVESSSGLTLTFATETVAARLASGGRYYLEVLTGSLEGERFDVDVEATLAAGNSTVVLVLGPASLSTTGTLAPGALVGARCAIRPHLTLGRLQSLFRPGLTGCDLSPLADGVHLLEDGAFIFYYLRTDGVTWSRAGSALDFRTKVIPPDASFVLEVRSANQAWVQAGRVRVNRFRKNLLAGFQSFATGFPVDLSPTQIGAFVDPLGAPDRRWTGNNVFVFADLIERLFRAGRPVDLFFLRGDGVTWRTLASPTDLSKEPLLDATGMILVRRRNADPGYSIRPPFLSSSR
jgi:hypothetical protein